MSLLLPTRPAVKPHAGTRGFTLVEIAIAVTLLTIGFLGFGALCVTNARTFDLADQESLVLNAMRDQAEKMRNTPFAQIASTYQNYTSTFGPPVNGTLTVTIFLNETVNTGDSLKFGLPRDLNGDGDSIDTNVAADYTLLPAKVAVSWTNLLGSHSEALYLMFAKEKI